jgi:hypothetical protein
MFVIVLSAMMKRVLLAGLLGGLAMFVWESVAHMALPLGEAGIKALDNEPAMIAAVQQNVKGPGFYFFPAPENRPGMTAEQKHQAMQAAMNKIAAGPSGIMVITPTGMDPMTPTQLAIQFGTDVVLMLIAAFLVSHALAPANFRRRAMFVAILGLIPTLAVEIPYWNWYRFPGTYIAAQFIVHLVGFAVGGLVIARMIGTSAHLPAVREMAA